MAKQSQKQGNASAKGVSQSRWARHQPVYERLLFGVALLGVLTVGHMMLTASTNFEQDCFFGAFESQTQVSGCQAAFESAVGKPLGVSNAVWGGLFYLAVAGLGVAIAMGAQARRPLLKKVRAALLAAGFLYSLFLTAYQFIVLPARCPLCMISAGLVAGLVVVQAVYLFNPVDASARTMKAFKKKREGALYGALAVLALLLIGADIVYFNNVDFPTATPTTEAAASLQTAASDATDTARNECRWDPTKTTVADLSVLIDERDPDVGKADSPVTVIEIFDPNCPHCGRLHPIMKSVVARYSEEVHFVYKPIVLPQFRYSVLQNAVLFAADEEGKFSEMLDLQFERQKRGGLTGVELKELATSIGIDADAMEQRIKAGTYDELLQRGNKQVSDVGVSGVPTVLINGRFVDRSSRTEACLNQFIEEALQNARAEG